MSIISISIFSKLLIYNSYKKKTQKKIPKNIIADEHLAELMPIFERIRAQGGLPISYPLHVTSGGTAFIGGTRSTPLSPHAPHCHPSTHWVSLSLRR